MAFSFGGDSVCAASNEGIGSSDVMRLAAPSLRPSRRFVGTRGVLSELFALSFMEMGPPRSSGLCDHAQAAVAARYTALASLNHRLASDEIDRTEYDEKRKLIGR
jgi:hypothetical protein